jgi:hypothetical protein
MLDRGIDDEPHVRGKDKKNGLATGKSIGKENRIALSLAGS